MIDCRFMMIRATCVLSEVIVSLNDREYIPKTAPDKEAPAALICKASPPSTFKGSYPSLAAVHRSGPHYWVS
jgi:hypothetical protein